jgi:hypothetical protein
MRVEYENGGLSALVRYFLGCLLKSADCSRHFFIGESEKPIPLLHLSDGEEWNLGEHFSGEMPTFEGEIRS